MCLKHSNTFSNLLSLNIQINQDKIKMSAFKQKTVLFLVISYYNFSYLIITLWTYSPYCHLTDLVSK